MSNNKKEIKQYKLNKDNNTIGTPRNLIKWIEEHNDIQFDFDCCPENSIIDNLRDDVEWGNYNFCNPPYGSRSSGIKQFITRAIYEKETNNKTTFFLIPNNSSTNYYNTILQNFDSIIFLKPLKFRGYEHNFPKPLLLVEFSGENEHKKLRMKEIDVLGKNCIKIYWK